MQNKIYGIAFVLLHLMIMGHCWGQDASFSSPAQEIFPCPDLQAPFDPPLTESLPSSSSTGASASVILLVPGAGSQDDDLFLGVFKWGKYFGEFQRELENHRIHSLVVGSDKYGNENLQSRARRVAQAILSVSKGGRKVFLVGHSMGGLAIRVALRDKALWPHVSGALSISTPHHGTPLVDFLLSDNVPMELVRRLGAMFGFDEKHKDYMGELSVANRKKWQGPEDFEPGRPPYFSLLVSNSIRQKLHSVPPLALTHQILIDLLAPKIGWSLENDGLVPLNAQLWGHCLGRVQLDHGSVIGKTLGPKERGHFKSFVRELVAQLKAQKLVL